jgi:hypothetical protein
MELKKGEYYSALSKGNILDLKPIEGLIAHLKLHLLIEPLPEELLERSNKQTKITEELTRLPLFIASGTRSWGGLVIAFPGSTKQLTTEAVGTPYLRKILYPILELHRRINNHFGKRLPCIYILGTRFPDVFARKFKLLSSVTPHVIIITSDLLKNAVSGSKLLSGHQKKINEAWTQDWLCRAMNEPNGIKIPTNSCEIQLGYLCREIPASEGTTQPERLDILGYDKSDHSLIAFEIKGPNCSRSELENLFLQGLEHQKWLERNKMVIKFLYDKPTGRLISTRKRVRLILGFYNEDVPELFWELRKQAVKHDRFLNIDFVQFTNSGGINGTLLLVAKTDS